jgi:hypothetical protein
VFFTSEKMVGWKKKPPRNFSSSSGDVPPE